MAGGQRLRLKLPADGCGLRLVHRNGNFMACVSVSVHLGGGAPVT